MLASTFAIAGVPLFSGFLSKDAILAGTLSFAQQHPQHFLLPIFGFGAAAITAFYMFRMMFLTFHGKPKIPEIVNDIHESPREMTGPIALLGMLSLYIWYTLPNNLSPMASYGWFNPKLYGDKFIGGLVHPVDSRIPGIPNAVELSLIHI